MIGDKSCRKNRVQHALLLLAASAVLSVYFLEQRLWTSSSTQVLPRNTNEIRHKCKNLHVKPGSPKKGRIRSQSDRFQEGTKPLLIRNATLWTGNTDGPTSGDIFVDGGLIKVVGRIDADLYEHDEVEILDAKGSWVTPGIIDVHSHLGGSLSAPGLKGTLDTESNKGPVVPWLRSLDALNTHDEGFSHSMAGGVTTSLILPGSENVIGGQAFVMKLRPTTARSPTSFLVEPPFENNVTELDPHRWRYMKHACGENLANQYKMTRMDSVWLTRQAYDKARQIKEAQDAYCVKVEQNLWKDLGDFPEELQWEALVDTLRGRVRVQTHCYEAVDLDAFLRLSHEFKFPVAAFHHAHEAYLVPDTLKTAYESPPSIALYTSLARYKREAFRASEYAARILNDAGINVVIKSDHNAINARYLMHEAQQAHYYGLPADVSLASVTTNAAKVLGLDHRIGKLERGYDADIAVWDSHPLSLGATPAQVVIDGIPQLKNSFVIPKPVSLQLPPITPNYDTEAVTAVEYDGVPPLEPASTYGTVVFTNVSSVWVRDGSAGVKAMGEGNPMSVVVVDGRVFCTSASSSTCISSLSSESRSINLQGGAIMPGLVSYGSQLGLQEIPMEPSTTDGEVYDPLQDNPPSIFGGSDGAIKAVDGLQFGTRDALLAYRAGVTTAIVAPTSYGFLSGISTAFSLASEHKLEQGAVIQDDVALHIAMTHQSFLDPNPKPSISTRIATLRRLLLHTGGGELGAIFKRVLKGEVTLAITIHSADAMASLIALKREIEYGQGVHLKMAFVGATEAHIVAKEIAEAKIGVIINPGRPFPFNWESRRYLAGPPLTKQSLVSLLKSQGVKVGLSGQGAFQDNAGGSWAVRNLRWDAGWAQLESNGTITEGEMLSMVSSNIEEILGMKSDAYMSDLVATTNGNLFSFESRVVAVISSRRGKVDILTHDV